MTKGSDTIVWGAEEIGVKRTRNMSL